MNTKVVLDKNLIFCTTPDCEGVLDISKAIKKKITCTKCKNKLCCKCKLEFHGNNSCEKHSQK